MVIINFRNKAILQNLPTSNLKSDIPSSLVSQTASQASNMQKIYAIVQGVLIVQYNDQMIINLVKKVVAGPKITTRYEGNDLDLTYITERVIAMAFPASDHLEKIYRNNIEDVSAYLQEHHSQRYLVVNVSSRDYDYSAFKNRVKSYQWPDHQTPPFTTLIQVAYDMYLFLQSKAGSVVAVHCNHGKGRTGTAIISLLLLINFFKSAVECLKFYNSKRFNRKTYGVDQPCQLRYLKYIQAVIEMPKVNRKLICYRLKGLTHRGLDEDYYLNISFTRNQEIVHERLKFRNHRIKQNDKILLADIFIELFYENWAGRKKVARINYNLFFLNGETKLKFRGENIKVESGHSSEFEFTLHFEYYCLCHLPAYQESVCKCRLERIIEEKYWSDMAEQVEQCKKMNKNDAIELLYYRKQRSSKRLRPYSNNLESEQRQVWSASPKKFKNAHQAQIYTYYHNCELKKQIQKHENRYGKLAVLRSKSSSSEENNYSNEENYDASVQGGSPMKEGKEEQVQAKLESRKQGSSNQQDQLI